MPQSETITREQTAETFDSPIRPKADSTEEKTIDHYKNSYSLAKTAVNFGNISKIAGFAVAGIIGMLALFLTLILVSTYREAGIAFVVFLILVTVGAAIGALFYGLGIALNASGKSLSASVDSAVQGSPFLTKEQKAHALNTAHRWDANGENS